MAPLLAFLILGCYLLGAVPFGYLVARWKGVDIRRHGSGNVGATNVGRVLGRRFGVLVLALDAAKGAAATVTAGWLMTRLPSLGGLSPSHRDLVLLGAGAACVIGNILPIYLRFRGGKGVATSLGVVLGIYPYLTWPALAVAAVWVLVVLATRYVSLGSIAAAGLLPPVFAAMAWWRQWSLAEHYPLLILCLLMAAAVLIRHRGNIRRLLDGTENRIGGKDG